MDELRTLIDRVDRLESLARSIEQPQRARLVTATSAAASGQYFSARPTTLGGAESGPTATFTSEGGTLRAANVSSDAIAIGNRGVAFHFDDRWVSGRGGPGGTTPPVEGCGCTVTAPLCVRYRAWQRYSVPGEGLVWVELWDLTQILTEEYLWPAAGISGLPRKVWAACMDNPGDYVPGQPKIILWVEDNACAVASSLVRGMGGGGLGEQMPCDEAIEIGYVQPIAAPASMTVICDEDGNFVSGYSVFSNFTTYIRYDVSSGDCPEGPGGGP